MLWGQVGDNASMTRDFVLSLHLVNTRLLPASLALCAQSAGAGSPAQSDNTRAPRQPSTHALNLRNWYIVGLLGVAAVAVTGTIPALGNTLFPVPSLVQGLSWDLYGSPNPLLRLRIIHPVAAATVGVYMLTLHCARFVLRMLQRQGARRAPARLRRPSVCARPLNLLLLTPLWP